jgi:hypothetical protein
MSIRQFQAQRMQAPRDFTAIPNRPICVEIGAGKGKHALLFTGQHPHTALYAIERTKEKFVAMQKQHQLEPREYLHPVHADALPWVVHALFPAQVEQFFILYPNLASSFESIEHPIVSPKGSTNPHDHSAVQKSLPVQHVRYLNPFFPP